MPATRSIETKEDPDNSMKNPQNPWEETKISFRWHERARKQIQAKTRTATQPQHEKTRSTSNGPWTRTPIMEEKRPRVHGLYNEENGSYEPTQQQFLTTSSHAKQTSTMRKSRAL